MWKFSYSFRNMAIFYYINWIVAAETIEGGKLFKGENYLRKYGRSFIDLVDALSFWFLLCQETQQFCAMHKRFRVLKTELLTSRWILETFYAPGLFFDIINPERNSIYQVNKSSNMIPSLTLIGMKEGTFHPLVLFG